MMASLVHLCWCGVDAAAVVVDDAVNGANVVLGVAVGEDVVSVDDDVVCC